MTCPRCHGLIVNEYEEERCLNCGYRTDRVPVMRSAYRPLEMPRPEPVMVVVDQVKVRGMDKWPRVVNSPSDARAAVRERVRKYRAKKKGLAGGA